LSENQVNRTIHQRGPPAKAQVPGAGYTSYDCEVTGRSHYVLVTVTHHLQSADPRNSLTSFAAFVILRTAGVWIESVNL